MKNEPEINIYGDAILFTLNGKTPPDFESGLKKCFDRYGQEKKRNPECFLRTFVDVSHVSALDFFLRNGFYINNTMLFMKRDLSDFLTGLSNTDKDRLKGPILTDLDIEEEVKVEEYRINSGLSEYLSANAEGFGEQDPENMIRDELAKPNSKIFVARLNGKIVSSVTVWQLDNGTFATENIFTVPKFRNRHIARELLKKTLLYLSEIGKTARLSVFGDDFEAIGLYYSLGFELKEEKYELRY